MFAEGDFVSVARDAAGIGKIAALKGSHAEIEYFHSIGKTHRVTAPVALLRQRAASRGMSGLLSSRIELHSHQVEVIRRVLEDPVQRYLLADEVGLGKTIEAGAILRQYLIDDPSGQALVIVPPLLAQQWS